MWTRAFWKATIERVIATAAAAAVGLWTGDGGDVVNVDFNAGLKLTAIIAALTLLKCLAASQLGSNPGPSITSAETLEPTP